MSDQKISLSILSRSRDDEVGVVGGGGGGGERDLRTKPRVLLALFVMEVM